MEMERNQEPGADVFQIEVAAAAAAQGYSPRGFPSFSCSPHPHIFVLHFDFKI